MSAQAQIIELLKRLQKEKKITYLFIIHDLLLARNICNRIAVMYKGSVVEMGTAEEITRQRIMMPSERYLEQKRNLFFVFKNDIMQMIKNKKQKKKRHFAILHY